MIALRMRVTVTASHDRDQSCNDYTITEVFDVRLSSWKGASTIKECNELMLARFTATYPHRGRHSRTPSLDTTVREVND